MYKWNITPFEKHELLWESNTKFREGTQCNYLVAFIEEFSFDWLNLMDWLKEFTHWFTVWKAVHEQIVVVAWISILAEEDFLCRCWRLWSLLWWVLPPSQVILICWTEGGWALQARPCTQNCCMNRQCCTLHFCTLIAHDDFLSLNILYFLFTVRRAGGD